MLPGLWLVFSLVKSSWESIARCCSGEGTEDEEVTRKKWDPARQEEEPVQPDFSDVSFSLNLFSAAGDIYVVSEKRFLVPRQGAAVRTTPLARCTLVKLAAV